MASPPFPLSLYGYLLLMVGSVVMSCVSLGTPHWVDASDKIHFGLFKSCSGDTCVKYSDLYNSYQLEDFNTIIGLLIAGLILNGGTFLIMAHLIFIRKTQVNTKNHGFLCVAVSIVGAVLTWAGTAKFINEIVDSPLAFYGKFPDWEFGYSMALGIVSGALALTAGIFSVFAVSYFVHCHLPNGMVVQPPFQPIMAGVPVVNTVANPYAMVTPAGTQPVMVAPMGTQPAVMGNYPNQGYYVTQAPPPAY